MPLPNSVPLSLHVNSHPVQSRPKHAMIVRMSAETLDALDAFPNNPPLSVDFGDVPGIYIGDAFFPMRPQKESVPHELYLRAASAAKPMAPLKLFANVIGKFMVERQLGDKVTDKVRQHTIVAKQQHMERQAILLDQPIPLPGHKNPKRKTPSGSVVKKAPPSDQLRPAPAPAPAPASTSTSRKVSPLPHASKANPDVRRRLVHFLAISPRLADDAVRMVGGANISSSARDDLLALLDDVAEEQAPTKKGDKSPRVWTLKPQTWTEVRPYEWPKLSEQGRVSMARQARLVFKALKIPESDSAWDNVRYRATAPTMPTSVPTPPPMAASNSNRSSASTQADSKRSATTTKDSKVKSRHDSSRTKGEIQMKDESTKPSASRLNAIKRVEADRPSSPSDGGNATKAVASRRLPGSGYQAKNSPQPSAVSEKSGTSTETRPAPKQPLPTSLPQKPSTAGGSHARKTIPAVPPKPIKKEDESDRERDRDYERQKEREREKRGREKERQREEWEREKEKERERERERVETEKREKAKQREREEREKRQREKVREREEAEQDKRRKEKETERERERTAGSAAPAFKRKIATQDVEDTLDDASTKSKRRKLGDGAVVASSSKIESPRKSTHELSPVPRLKMKKGVSSSQASATSQDRRATTTSAHKSERPSKTSSSSKPRRRSPIYTSSEDEGEIPQPRKRNPSPPPISERSNSSDQPLNERTHRTARRSYPPATDHVALRALYQSQYTTYLGTFSKVVAQKRKIEAMLNGGSDAEDVMDPEDLIKLNMEHQSLKSELVHIHDIYTGGATGATASSTSE